eukprot:NODE_1_length_95616_cov_0.657642.p4 type:complete len:824 gc:universal NODE_1_length_95616_cov_0.657642:60794-63265(+)
MFSMSAVFAFAILRYQGVSSFFSNTMSLSELLLQTLNPSTQKNATSSLFLLVESQPATLMSLCDLVISNDKVVSHTSAVFLKNSIAKHYHKSEYMDVNSRNVLKQRLLDLLIHPLCSKIVRQQISVSISSVADTDSWTDLPSILGSTLTSSSLETQLLCLETIYLYVTVWKKYDLSANVVLDIQHSCNTFFVPLFLPYIENCFSSLPSNREVEQYDIQFQLFLIISKIFKCFIIHDIPQQLEPHIPRLSSILCFFIRFNNPQYKQHEQNLLHESTKLTKLRGSILDTIHLLLSKYLDDVADIKSTLITAVWDLVIEYSFTVEESLNSTNLTTSTRDVMISKALQVICVCIIHNINNEIFLGNGNVESVDFLVNKVIIGNILVRREDLELFEDDPLSYAFRELHGTESSSINKSTNDLVSALLKFSPLGSSIISSCIRYIDLFIKSFNSNDPNSWKYKSTATRIICCLNQPDVCTQYIINHVLPDLNASSTMPLLLSDAIYCITHFKNLLGSEIESILTKLVEILHVQSMSSQLNTVVCTFSCNAISLLLSKSTAFDHSLLLTSVFRILSNQTGVYKSENEYYLKVVVKAILTMPSVELQNKSNVLLNELISILEIVGQNPINPKFNHYLFECIGMVLRQSSLNNPSISSQYDEELVPMFGNILRMDISEYSPYIFQILTIMCNTANTPNLDILMPTLVKPNVWESNGNIKSLVVLFSMYMVHHQEKLKEIVLPLLGVFQKLIQSKQTSREGMKLLQSMYHYNLISPEYTNTIFNVLLTRLNQNKQFGIDFTNFACYLSSNNNFGADYFINCLESIQQGYLLLI